MLSLYTYTGDADLYVNPAAALTADCFYNPSTSPHLPLWYSHTVSSVESVIIAVNEAHNVLDGLYCITVFSHGYSRYSLIGSGSGTIRTITSGVLIQDFISQNTYHYYRFYDDDYLSQRRLTASSVSSDTNPYHNLEIDITSTNGDADLYVSCDCIPSGISCECL